MCNFYKRKAYEIVHLFFWRLVQKWSFHLDFYTCQKHNYFIIITTGRSLERKHLSKLGKNVSKPRSPIYAIYITTHKYFNKQMICYKLHGFELETGTWHKNQILLQTIYFLV